MLILPKNDLLKQEVLKKVIVKFEKNKKYKGAEVAEILKQCNVDDYVLFRRELVNFGYFSRESYADVYMVIKYELSPEDMQKIGGNMNKFDKAGMY